MCCSTYAWTCDSRPTSTRRLATSSSAGKRPTRRTCNGRASGRTSGASSASTPTSDLRRRIQRRTPPDPFGAAAIPLHVHSCDAAGDTSVGRERVARLGHPRRRMSMTPPTVALTFALPVLMPSTPLGISAGHGTSFRVFSRRECGHFPSSARFPRLVRFPAAPPKWLARAIRPGEISFPINHTWPSQAAFTWGEVFICYIDHLPQVEEFGEHTWDYR